MANSRAANVIRVDTTADFEGPINISAIKYIGAESGSAVIEANGSDSDLKLWEESGASNTFNQVCIRDARGVRVEVSNNAVVYLYLK